MNDFLNTAAFSMSETSSAVIVFNILFTFLLCLCITYVYKKIHRSVSYSQTFVGSMIMMSVLATVAMMILGNNLTRALGVLGVFTLIRFRTIVKDPQDATYLFFALSVGMAVGTKNYAIAVITTALMSGINYVLYLTNFGSIVGTGFLLTLIVDDTFNTEKFTAVTKVYLRSANLIQLKTEESGERMYYYKIIFSHLEKYQEFLSEVQHLKGVKMADLVSGRDAAEY